VFGLISLLLAGTAAVLGFSFSRNFVRRRLAYVDAAQSGSAPIVAGVAAAVAAMPVAWILPLIGSGTALVFGASVAMGVASGAKDIRRRLHPG
jgi:uncharacterized membrane-anchored protein